MNVCVIAARIFDAWLNEATEMLGCFSEASCMSIESALIRDRRHSRISAWPIHVPVRDDLLVHDPFRNTIGQVSRQQWEQVGHPLGPCEHLLLPTELLEVIEKSDTHI